ncbi:hypothetical protein [Nocardia sp. CDC160]|uniref:hypothetical protein n=1 Tax=Nocardia sp. CDC160 TaxID=3112166 RepID=UPI002DBE397F|nr:hypothetical protein [Nocardia sp. CDC160]MEC3918750.1 hypothetical protein [Nocardia sp. CDC160]
MGEADESKLIVLEDRLRTALGGTHFQVRFVDDGLEVERPFSHRQTRTPFRYHLRLDENNSRAWVSPVYRRDDGPGDLPPESDRDPHDRTGDLIRAELAALDWRLEAGPAGWIGATDKMFKVLPVLGAIVLLALVIPAAAEGGKALVGGALPFLVSVLLVGGAILAIKRGINNRQ